MTLSGCAVPSDFNPVYTRESFDNLNGWPVDQHTAIRDPLTKSCVALAKQNGSKNFGPDAIGARLQTMKNICVQLPTVPDDNLRQFIEAHFDVYSVSNDGDAEGLFTGYYEASLRGSRTRHGPYQTPILRKPYNLVKGTAYAPRSVIINDRSLDAQAIAFADDAVDVFFLQIQGSGIVALDGGSTIQVGYDGQNGQKYFPIGAELVRRNELTKETVSMQSIRTWLATHPFQQDEIMNLNPSYVFFAEKAEGPIGAQGVVLTPERSLAVDRRAIPYGALIWLDAEDPLNKSFRLQKLLVAQDTGGAIKGAVRGDVFWGSGLMAEQKAGVMKSKGRYWLLMPKN